MVWYVWSGAAQVDVEKLALLQLTLAEFVHPDTDIDRGSLSPELSLSHLGDAIERQQVG
jgi:hypothetical protein